MSQTVLIRIFSRLAMFARLHSGLILMLANLAVLTATGGHFDAVRALFAVIVGRGLILLVLTCHARLAKSCARGGRGSTAASRARDASMVNGILTGSTLLAPRVSRARITFERTWRTIFTHLSPMLIFELTLRTNTARGLSCV